MRELIVDTTQLKARRLTTPTLPRYAGYEGAIFMAKTKKEEEDMDQKLGQETFHNGERTAPRIEVIKQQSDDNEWEHPETAAKAKDNETRTAVELAKLGWDTAVNKLDHLGVTPQQGIKLLEMGISPEMWVKLQESQKVLAEGLVNKPEGTALDDEAKKEKKNVERIERILDQWQKILHPKDYQNKIAFLFVQAENNITPKRFIDLYKFAWKYNFPNTPLKDVLKKKGLVTVFLKKIVMPALAETLYDMQGLTEEQKKKEREKRRNMEWATELAQQLKNDLAPERDRLPMDEQVQEMQAFKAIMDTTGQAPNLEMDGVVTEYEEREEAARYDRVMENAAVEDKHVRAQMAEAIIQQYDAGYTLHPAEDGEKSDEELLDEIHKIGEGGVYNYDMKEYLAKARGITDLLEKRGIKDKELQKKIRDELILEGVMGSKPSGGGGKKETFTAQQINMILQAQGLFQRAGFTEKQISQPLIDGFIKQKVREGEPVTMEDVMAIMGIGEVMAEDDDDDQSVDPSNPTGTPEQNPLAGLDDAQKEEVYRIATQLATDMGVNPDAAHSRRVMQAIADKITKGEAVDLDSMAELARQVEVDRKDQQDKISQAELEQRQKFLDAWNNWAAREIPNLLPAQISFISYLGDTKKQLKDEYKTMLKDIRTVDDVVDAINAIEGGATEYEQYYGRNIESMEDLVLAIVEYQKDEEHLWGPEGLFPLYQIVYEKNDKGEEIIDPTTGLKKPMMEKRTQSKSKNKNRSGGIEDNQVKIRANPSNLHKWIMSQMMYWQGENSGASVNFMQQISLFRKGGRGAYSLGQMLQYKNTFFKTKIYNEEREREEDYIVDDLYQQINKDVLSYQLNRDTHFDYLPVMGEAGGVNSFMAKLHGRNDFTRPVWNKQSFMRWAYYMPERFVSEVEKAEYSKAKLDKLTNEEKERQDGRVGAASALAEMVYRAMSNVEDGEDSLVALLGRDSIFFQKEKIIEMRNALSKNVFNVHPERAIAVSDIEKIFSRSGYLKAKQEAFEKLMKDNKTETLQAFLAEENPSEWDKYLKGDPKKIGNAKKRFLSRYLAVPNQKHDENPAEAKNVYINKDSFVKFFNVFDAPQKDPYITTLLQSMVQEAIAHKHKLFIEDGREDPSTKKRSYATKESGDTWYIKKINGNGREIFVPIVVEEGKSLKQAKEEVMARGESVWIMDNTSKAVAEGRAFFALRWTGAAALNDPDGTGQDWQTRSFYTEEYRKKGPTRKRNNDSGNLVSMGVYKGTNVDFMRGVQTLSEKSEYTDQYGNVRPVRTRTEKGEDGKNVEIVEHVFELDDDTFDPREQDKDKNQKFLYEKTADGKTTLFKTPLDVVREIVRAVELAEDDPKIGGLAKEANAMPEGEEKREKLKLAEARRQELMRKITSQFRFREQTQEKYYGDHFVRGHKVLEDILLKGKSMDFTKIYAYEPSKGGYQVNHRELQSQFEEMAKPWRYGISTWLQLDLQQEVDIPHPTNKGQLIMSRDQDGNMVKPCMAQKIFGNEVLDHPQFWKKDDGKGVMMNGKLVRGQLVEVTDDEGKITKELRIPHVIDPKEINTEQGKVQLYINAVLMQFGADMILHMKRKHHDKKYDEYFMEAMFESLAALPSKVVGDEIMSMLSIQLERNSITKTDLKWLRERIGAGKFKTVSISIFKALMVGFWQGGKKGFDIASKHVGQEFKA